MEPVKISSNTLGWKNCYVGQNFVQFCKKYKLLDLYVYNDKQLMCCPNRIIDNNIDIYNTSNESTVFKRFRLTFYMYYLYN